MDTDNMAQGTSIQTGLPGINDVPAQSKMFEECNTAIGQGGSKPGLIDIGKYTKRVINRTTK